MPTVDFARSEQRRCAEEYHDAGARLGMFDWFAEEFLMTNQPVDTPDKAVSHD